MLVKKQICTLLFSSLYVLGIICSLCSLCLIIYLTDPLLIALVFSESFSVTKGSGESYFECVSELSPKLDFIRYILTSMMEHEIHIFLQFNALNLILWLWSMIIREKAPFKVCPFLYMKRADCISYMFAAYNLWLTFKYFSVLLVKYTLCFTNIFS